MTFCSPLGCLDLSLETISRHHRLPTKHLTPHCNRRVARYRTVTAQSLRELDKINRSSNHSGTSLAWLTTKHKSSLRKMNKFQICLFFSLLSLVHMNMICYDCNPASQGSCTDPVRDNATKYIVHDLQTCYLTVFLFMSMVMLPFSFF
jgi:hypothetical protein